MNLWSLVRWLQTNKFRSLFVVFVSTIWFLFNALNAFPVGAVVAIFLWKKVVPTRKLIALIAVGTLVGFIGTGPYINLTVEERGTDGVRMYFGAGGQIGTLRLAKYFSHSPGMIVYNGGIDATKLQVMNSVTDSFFDDFNTPDFDAIVSSMSSLSEQEVSQDMKENIRRGFQSLRDETGAITAHVYKGYEHVDYENNALPDGFLSALYSIETASGEDGYVFLTAKIEPKPTGIYHAQFYSDDLIVKIEERD